MLYNIVVPDTYYELFIVVLFDNVVKPDIFNDDTHVILYVAMHSSIGKQSTIKYCW